MQSYDEKQNLYYNGNNINHSGDDIDAILRNVNEEEQVALWREGRRREPMPVEIDFWNLIWQNYSQVLMKQK